MSRRSSRRSSMEDRWCCVCRRNTSGQTLAAAGRGSCTSMMQYCLDIHIEAESTEWLYLCQKCIGKLKSFYKFKLMAIESFSKFQESLHIKNYPLTVLDHEDVQKIEPEEEQSIKCEHEDLHNIEPEELSIKYDHEDVQKIEAEEELSIKSEHDDGQCLINFLTDLKTEQEDGEPMSDFCTNQNRKNQNQFPLRSDEKLLIKKLGRPKIKSASTAPSVKKREKVKWISQPGMCDLCGLTFKDLKAHKQVHMTPSERKRYPCDRCGKTFANYNSRRRHIKFVHHHIDHAPCPTCGKVVNELSKHIKRQHMPSLLAYACNACGRRFLTARELRQHAGTHGTHGTPHVCDACGQVFRHKVTLVVHRRRVHDKERKYVCDHCSKPFFSKYHLITHLACTHSNARPMVCAECGARFKTEATLRVHRLRHAGRRDHACSRCDRAFVTSGALKVHMISHTRERKYACAYCPDMFGRSDHRNRHQRTAHKHPT